MAKKANMAKKPTKRLKKGSKLEATQTLSRSDGGGATVGRAN